MNRVALLSRRSVACPWRPRVGPSRLPQQQRAASAEAAAVALDAQHSMGVPEGSRRPGLMFIKAGMLGLFDKWGKRHACTVLALDECRVVQVKCEETEGYDAVQVGASLHKPSKAGSSVLGHYERHGGLPPMRRLKESRVSPDALALLRPGLPLDVRHFVAGQRVDVQGVSRGKGFAGGMKRHGFAGLDASHGVSKAHRSIGSTGQCQTPGRVFKGKKMPGRMGGVTTTVQGVRVYRVSPSTGVILVKGSIPGPAGGYVRVSDCIKGADFPEPPPFPTYIRAGEDDTGEDVEDTEMAAPEHDVFELKEPVDPY